MNSNRLSEYFTNPKKNLMIKVNGTKIKKKKNLILKNQNLNCNKIKTIIVKIINVDQDFKSKMMIQQ